MRVVPIARESELHGRHHDVPYTHTQVAKEIWVCDKSVAVWKGTIRDYKDKLRKDMAEAAEKNK